MYSPSVFSCEMVPEFRSAVKCSLFLEPEPPPELPSTLISANCFKGHSVCFLSPNPRCHGLWPEEPCGHMQQLAGRRQAASPLLSISASSGFSRRRICALDSAFPMANPPTPPVGPSDSQAPFSRPVGVEQPFPRASRPWKGHSGDAG